MAASNWSWKDAAIGGLWAVTMALAVLGFTAIKDNIIEVKTNQAAAVQVMATHISNWGKWEVQYERDRSVTWRVLDRLCGYQSERLRKEGKIPDYFPINPNSHSVP